MSDPSEQVQNAIFEKINANINIATLFAPVAGGAEQTPRIEFEKLETRPHDVENTFQHTITFSVWSDLYELDKGTETAAKLKEVLDNQNLSMTHYTCVACRFSSMESQKQINASSWKHQVKFNCVTELTG